MKKKRAKAGRPVNLERHALVMDLRDNKHYSFRKIGKMMGFTHNRALAIYYKNKKDKKLSPEKIDM